ncbi:MAG: SRPBCC domain-containing protein [Paracoccaceae bacterium]|nr:SRPBCC domain-containing protein [Paracoccaceae bacterium]
MTLNTGHFEFKRSLALPPERLWEVLTDPRHRENWGAPEEGMVLTVETADLSEGGQDRHRCGPAEAPDFVVDTRWYRLEAPHRAVFTETVIVGDEAVATSLVTYALGAAGRGTALEVGVAVSSFVGPEAASEFHAGWEGGLANLDAYLAKLDATAGAA